MAQFSELLDAALAKNEGMQAIEVLAKLSESPMGFATAINELADHYKGCVLTRVVSVQSERSMVAAPVAARLGALFLNSSEFPAENEQGMIRCFTLIHGSNALEQHPAFIGPDDTVLIVCDSISAVSELAPTVERILSVGARIAGIGTMMLVGGDAVRNELLALGAEDVFALAEI